MALRSRLLLQPYGAAIIDPRAKVYFLNETAADIALALVDGCTPEQATDRIATIYEITRSEAQPDIEDFLQHSEVAPLLRTADKQAWDVLGSDEYTSIVEADICLTNQCNLECSYCYAEAGKAKNGELSPEQWVETARTLIRLGMRKATVAGGEPTLSKAFFSILEVLVEHGVAVQLFTNGLLIKDSTVSRLKEIPINFVQISLDSTREEDHNRYRGHSHSLALRAIRLLASSGIPVVIGANIFPDTIAEVSRLAELADSTGASLRCNAIEARGRAARFDENETVVNESFTAAIARSVEDASGRYPHVFAEQEVSRTLETHERICPFSKGCIAVTALGEIRPCSQADTFFKSVAPWAMDNKKVCEYSTTIEEHTAFSTIAAIRPEVCPTKDICGSCGKYPICTGCLPAGHTCKERR